MSLATVYSTAQYGLADESAASGLYAGTATFTATSEQATAPDHIGCDVGFAVYNQKKDVTLDGIVATKGTGLIGSVGATITLLNTTKNSRTRLTEFFTGTPATGAAIIITGGETSGTATGFETGSLTGIYNMFVAAGSPVTLT